MKGAPVSNAAYVGIGANLGDKLATMRAAIGALASDPDVSLDLDRDVAPLYETKPHGVDDPQPVYFNSVFRIETTRTPLDLLSLLLEIERNQGRVRRDRWEPRPIDLDLLLYGDVVMSADTLTLPHPRMTERLFVMEPLSSLAPSVVVDGQSALWHRDSLRTAAGAGGVTLIGDSKWVVAR